MMDVATPELDCLLKGAKQDQTMHTSDPADPSNTMACVLTWSANTALSCIRHHNDAKVHLRPGETTTPNVT